MAHYLQNIGHEVVVFSPEDGELYKRSAASKLNVCRINWKKNNYYNPIFLYRLWRNLRSQSLDVIVFNSFIDIRDASLVSRLASIQKRVLRVGMPIVPKLNFIYKASFRFGLSHFVGISHEIYKLFNKSGFLQNLNTSVIPNGIDIDKFKFKERDFKFLNNSPVFGNCVRLSDQKGLFGFLNIVKFISNKISGAKFIIAGDGELESELKEYAKKMGIDDKVLFLGHVEDVPGFYDSIDFLIFTSKYEGTARTLIEAMSSGVPVFCYDTSSMSEMITHGRDGFKVPPFDEDEFCHRILEVFTKKNDSLSELAKAARQKVAMDYSKSINFVKWEKTLLSD